MFLISVISFIVALGILVAVHEWGHFWVARRCGVKVERFSIGFGKAFWKRKDRHGTEFVLAAIPLGGYVKMLDERVEEVKEKDLPHAFNRQHVLKRIAIIAAGPVVNFLFAILALLLMYLIGLQTIKPVVGKVATDSILSQTGISRGGVLTQVGSRKVADWNDVNLELISHIGRDELFLKWLPENSSFEKSATINISAWEFDPDKLSALESLGIQSFRPKATTKMGLVVDGMAASAAGIRKNDIILSLDGTKITKWRQIVDYIEDRAGQSVIVTIQRNDQIKELSMDVGYRPIPATGMLSRFLQYLGLEEQQVGTSGYVGIAPFQEAWPEGVVFTHQYGLIDASVRAMDKTWRLMIVSVEMLGKLVTGDVSVKNLSGPIAIAQGAGMSASAGLVHFLNFLALISVSLGIINLLPLPMLDGGHLLYYFIELLSGRPVPDSIQEKGLYVGGFLLLMFMSIAIVNDIARL